MFSWIWPSKEVWERNSAEDQIAFRGYGADH